MYVMAWHSGIVGLEVVQVTQVGAFPKCIRVLKHDRQQSVPGHHVP